MDVLETALPGVLLIQPTRFSDARGWFQENIRAELLSQYSGHDVTLAQSNTSFSLCGVLRGLHAQKNQGKLISVVHGRIFDVAVDIRPESATFGQHITFDLTAETGHLVWLPPGFAHGFLTLSPDALVHYVTSAVYSAPDEICLKWDDPDLGIAWPLTTAPSLSAKDQQGLSWAAFSA